ncbi:TetR/AcrR family transcriptional regulator [Rhizobium tropici]|uniref:AcrR family transcriptional regulator n=1 Tax=Rhizobium tropici TaxID=398 RepID=A0A6P1C0C4_RHITR|nr:TetR/AcrR family transcriptional regulator [Rhizobium tropici]MBB4243425.1 AcrR family transcriptional regulator [Rhizobium tropici]MBB5593080.1 AcrR family transcriptional regulator [Rhizobium tropici]MBB6493733.1 AcrR family transcriptional regulator [Rhizobium tropici]NEV09977.1 TetR/AcrR family transcriptional regulator [Rhizobium tropici]
MENGLRPPLNPRKSPRQGRSIATVDAIFEATIQVLLSDGLIRFNTTRVARRAGVSVGTLYQYFPNKQALLFAVLERHLLMIAEAVEKACDENRLGTVETIAEAVVTAYLQVQIARAEVSPALYRIGLELDARELIDSAVQRSTRAVEATLSDASNDRFADVGLIAQTLTAALYGTVPAFCHKVLSVADGIEAERQLTIMFRSYLAAHRVE